MKSFYLDNDMSHLYFANCEKRSDEEEYEEIMSILRNANCKIGKSIMGPDCDVIECEIDGVSFDVIHTIDGDGTFLYCNHKAGMKKLECIFTEV
ncbi:hypothetical protein NE619_18175 [Anaerovorax odorimutans]|uniref:Uncharacterized protein n=1 Tax=Anaerovorax odorimutans TaxID=109327 RepID=A0ABT1RTY6_9FIRM|nr:hypothetical protein [Anaerovorax odorimutans]MCQ4638657.1 hypothetical protein [Anaerovorax odorimutans]